MLYQGQQQDAESNLYYLRARYYDPTIGRFISKDPVKGTLTLPQSQNPYAYSINNPINLSDPSGEFIPGVVAACAVAARAACADGDCTNEARAATAFLQNQSNKLPGVYSFIGNTGKEYVGKNVDLLTRIGSHISSGKLPESSLNTLKVEVGNPETLRVLEQTKINSQGGVTQLENIINAVDPKYWNTLNIPAP